MLIISKQLGVTQILTAVEMECIDISSSYPTFVACIDSQRYPLILYKITTTICLATNYLIFQSLRII